MHRLNDIIRISRDLLDKKTPPDLAPSLTPTFDLTWFIFMTAPGRFHMMWNGFEEKHNKDDKQPIAIKTSEAITASSVKFATQIMSMAYIVCGLNCAARARIPVDEPLKAGYSNVVGRKLMYMIMLGNEIAKQPLPLRRGELPQDLSNALGEFYSLSIFVLNELKPNIDPIFHAGINQTVLDYKIMMGRFNLPRFLSADEHAAEAAAQQGVTRLPTRPGIATNQQGAGATIVSFGAISRSTTRPQDP